MDLTGRKDTDLIILSNLDDRSLLSYCQTNRYGRELCRNENFWRNRFIKKYGTGYDLENRTWKNFYLSLLVYFNKPVDEYLGKINEALFNAAESKDKEAVEFLISQGATNWNAGLEGAAAGGELELVNFFLDKAGENAELDTAMAFAAEMKHYDIVRELADRGGDVGFGLRQSVNEDRLDLVKLYLSLRPNIVDIENALENARLTDKDEIANYIERYLYGS